VGALQNVKVLDLTRILAGPFCTMILGDMGADVIKVESPPDGDQQRVTYPLVDGVSAGFYAVNRNKRSIILDLKDKSSLEAFYRLVAKADVVVENFRLGVTERLGIDYATLAKINPAIVYASISGYGQYGPYSHMGGYDPIAQAMTGLMSATGSEGGDPVKISVPLTDIGSGMMAAIGILTAYVHRLNTGQGQQIDASLFDTGVAFSVWDIVSQLHTGVTPRPLGTRHRLVAPSGAFKTSDGQIMFSASDAVMWKRFTKLIGRQDMAEDPRFATGQARGVNVAALSDAIQAEMVKKSTAEWLAAFQSVGMPCGPIRSYDEVVEDPHVAAREMLIDLPHPNGQPIRVPGMPIKMSGTPAKVGRRPPMLGEHTEEVLTEFGFSSTEIQALLATVTPQ